MVLCLHFVWLSVASKGLRGEDGRTVIFGGSYFLSVCPASFRASTLETKLSEGFLKDCLCTLLPEVGGTQAGT